MREFDSFDRACAACFPGEMVFVLPEHQNPTTTFGFFLYRTGKGEVFSVMARKATEPPPKETKATGPDYELGN